MRPTSTVAEFRSDVEIKEVDSSVSMSLIIDRQWDGEVKRRLILEGTAMTNLDRTMKE